MEKVEEREKFIKENLLNNIDEIVKELTGESDIIIKYSKRDNKIIVSSQKIKRIV